MLDSVIVIGVVALLIAILKASVPYFQTDVGQMWLKLLMFFAAGTFNIVNGIGFSGDAITLSAVLGYFKDGLILGAAASGIYGMGKDLTDSTASLAAAGNAGFHPVYVPARRQSMILIVTGTILWLFSSVLYGFVSLVYLDNVIGSVGFVIVIFGYLVGTVSAARNCNKARAQT